MNAARVSRRVPTRKKGSQKISLLLYGDGAVFFEPSKRDKEL